MSNHNLIAAPLDKLRAVWRRVNARTPMAGPSYIPLSTITIQDAEYLYRAKAHTFSASIERLIGAGATIAQKGS